MAGKPTTKTQRVGACAPRRKPWMERQREKAREWGWQGKGWEEDGRRDPSRMSSIGPGFCFGHILVFLELQEFCTADTAKTWMSRSNYLLGGACPWEVVTWGKFESVISLVRVLGELEEYDRWDLEEAARGKRRVRCS